MRTPLVQIMPLTKRLALLLIIIGVSSCSGLAPTYRPYRTLMVIYTPHPAYYQSAGSAPGEKLGWLEFDKGDTVSVVGYYWGALSGDNYWLVEYQGKNVFVEVPNLLLPCEYHIEVQPSSFILPRKQGETAWARGTKWIAEHTRIEQINDSLIQTTRGGWPARIEYKLTRSFIDDSVEIRVEVTAAEEVSLRSVDETARKLAWYMVSGNECTRSQAYKDLVDRPDGNVIDQFNVK